MLPALAQPEMCQPVRPPPVIGCSLAAVEEARLAGTDRIPVLAQLQAAQMSDLREIFDDGGRRPGQAQISLSGLVTEAGTACAQPLAELDISSLLLSGAIDPDTAKGDVESRAEMLRERVQGLDAAGNPVDMLRALGAVMGGGQDGAFGIGGLEGLNALIPSDADTRDVVFHLASPATYRIGGRAGPVTHGGRTGWRPQAAAAFAVQLPGIRAEDLEPGERYDAVAEAPRDKPQGILPTLPAFYFWWEETATHFQHTMLHGRLEGEVLIEEITDTGVYGVLQLSGPTVAVTELSEKRETHRELIERREQRGPLQISARFEAPNGAVPSVAMLGSPALAQARGGRRTPVLQVESYFPPGGARNADRDDPGLVVEFDRALDPSALGASVARIEYLDSAGALTTVATDLGIRGERLFITPQQSLEPAAWYRVVVAGGAAGPRGRDGARLPRPFGFTFATAPDLYDIEPRLFQVARDTPLIAGKQTLTRLYVEWARPLTHHEDWHVRRIPANAWVTDETRENILYPVEEEIEVPHRDMVTQEDRRLALNTVNFFGWQPEPDQTRRAFGVIEPLDPCERPLREEDGATEIAWSDLQTELTFDYYMMRVGSWRDGVPAQAHSIARRTVANAETFTEQTFPVTGVHGRYAGEFTLPPAWHDRYAAALEIDEDDEDKSYTAARHAVMHELETAVLTHGGPDQIVAFFPPDMFRGGTSYPAGPVWEVPLQPEPPATYLHELGRRVLPPDRPSQLITFNVPLTALETKPAAVEKPVITHEFGHAYGLEHRPWVLYAYDRRIECRSGGRVMVDGVSEHVPERRNWSGIEGFRLAQDGSGGANKSYEEGNGETTWGLMPLMYPCAFLYERHFISRDNYLHLLGEIAQRHADAGPLAPAAPRPAWHSELARALSPVRAANAHPGHNQYHPAEARLYVVTGMLDDAGQARIDSVSPIVRRSAPPPPDSDVRLVLVDAAGEVLARRAVDAPVPGAGFVALVESPAPPHRVELHHGDTRLAALTRTPHPPEIRDFRVAGVEGDTLRLSWQADDPDGDDLDFTLLYRAAPDAPWMMVAAPISSTDARVPRNALVAGEAALLRLVASDGMNRAHAEVWLDPSITHQPARPVPTDGFARATPMPDPGPPPLRAGILANPDMAPQAETAATVPAAPPDPAGAPSGRFTIGAERVDFEVLSCARDDLGGMGEAIELRGRAGPEGGARLSVTASIVSLPDREHQLIEAQQIDGAGEVLVEYVAMHSRRQGGAWRDLLGGTPEGPLLTIDGRQIAGQGMFSDQRANRPDPQQGGLAAECADLTRD
ncbi:Ig-like domain-containing protein [Alkalilacustris brevis]|uniref:Ig-like domain-containing protein n=1 Tax=Alkalilacustris brevis TaxID=2026338 RepID=UPI0012D2FC3A|nr:Ig-like domain-containing protein [Alkalilacustris brevis]